MANETIDSLAKVLAGSTAHRRALKGVAAVGAGGLLTRSGGSTPQRRSANPISRRLPGSAIRDHSSARMRAVGSPKANRPGKLVDVTGRGG
jgi:hypothetical protein